MLERSNAHQLDACQKQLGVLQLQIQQAKDDRDALDAQLPRGGGPIASRLQAAEKELAALEELTPLDTRRSAARQEAEAAARRADEAERRIEGRPATLARGSVGRRAARSTSAPSRSAGSCSTAIGSPKRSAGWSQRREELVRRQRELDALAARIVQLAADAGVSLVATGPIEQLRQLAEAAAQQEAAAARRDAHPQPGAAPPRRPGQA